MEQVTPQYVTIVEITDRCDFSKVLERKAFLGRDEHGRFEMWGRKRCDELLEECRQGKYGGDESVFDPQCDVTEVELA